MKTVTRLLALIATVLLVLPTRAQAPLKYPVPAPMKPVPRMLTLLIALVLALPALALVPDTLLYPIPAPFGVAQKDSQLGYCVATDGDYIVASAPNDYVVKVFDATTGAPLFELARRELTGTNFYGNAVAISGTLVAVASMGETTGGFIHSGRVPVATLHNPTPATGDNFGVGVAIEGVTVVVGAPGDDTITFNKGYAYVFGPTTNPNDLDSDGLLDSWEIAYFGSTFGHTALGDDEEDGVANLLEEAFDTDPLRSNAPAVPAVVIEGGYLTMTIAKRPGVTYEVQSAGTPDAAAFSAVDTTVLVNGATTLKVRDNFLIGTTPGRYLRVKVTAAP